MVDPEKIRQLVEMMAEHELSEICWRSGEEEIRLKRPGVVPTPSAAPPPLAAPPAAAPAVNPPTPEPAAAPAVDEDAGLVPIKSPMVGTFYAASDPESPPFISAGARVTPNSVVCILEAMKVFNEIKAEIAGTVKKVLVKNEDPVEFGQPLFLVQPD